MNQETHCYDNSTRARNPSDCGNLSPTLQAHLGTGGGNVPLVISYRKALKNNIGKCFGIKCNQSEKSQKPWSEDIAQCLSASCHDASVILITKKKKRSV